jgi:hypothetical protein
MCGNIGLFTDIEFGGSLKFIGATFPICDRKSEEN